MPVLRTKKLGKVLASAVLAAALVVAPLVTAGASAAKPSDSAGTIGVEGKLETATSEANDETYWEQRYAAHKADCYKTEGNNPSGHGKLTDGGLTVTLYPFQQSWPGDHWEVLVVKAGNTNNVIEHPVAGTAYASPVNGGGQQATVSHWIVCKGTTPTQPTAVTPSLTFTLPSCVAAGELIKSANVIWTSVANPDGSTLWKAKAIAGQVLAAGAQSEWLVPNLAKLAAELELCRPPAGEKTVVSHDYDCDSETVITKTVVTTTPYVWGGTSWVPGESTDATTTETREMTADEKVDCPPDTDIEYSEWVEGEWDCGDTEVTLTREVTTTVYDYNEQAQPTATSSVSQETKTRDLTPAELAECPLLPGDISSVCVGDVPYLGYSVSLPEGVTADSPTPVTITFVNPSGEDYVIENQPLFGTVLWPGASATEPKMWPGWALVNGEYVETEGNFAWTRAGVTVLFEVNPTYETVIEYPQATALCANAPASGDGAAALAVTGSTVPVWAIGGAAAAVLAGVAFTVFAVMRRRTTTS